MFPPSPSARRPAAPPSGWTQEGRNTHLPLPIFFFSYPVVLKGIRKHISDTLEISPVQVPIIHFSPPEAGHRLDLVHAGGGLLAVVLVVRELEGEALDPVGV